MQKDVQLLYCHLKPRNNAPLHVCEKDVYWDLIDLVKYIVQGHSMDRLRINRGKSINARNCFFVVTEIIFIIVKKIFI